MADDSAFEVVIINNENIVYVASVGEVHNSAIKNELKMVYMMTGEIIWEYRVLTNVGDYGLVELIGNLVEITGAFLNGNKAVIYGTDGYNITLYVDVLAKEDEMDTADTTFLNELSVVCLETIFNLMTNSVPCFADVDDLLLKHNKYLKETSIVFNKQRISFYQIIQMILVYIDKQKDEVVKKSSVGILCANIEELVDENGIYNCSNGNTNRLLNCVATTLPHELIPKMSIKDRFEGVLKKASIKITIALSEDDIEQLSCLECEHDYIKCKDCYRVVYGQLVDVLNEEELEIENLTPEQLKKLKENLWETIRMCI